MYFIVASPGLPRLGNPARLLASALQARNFLRVS
jgi:hypothetical protein